MGSDTVKMTEQSDVSDSHGTAGSAELQRGERERERGSGGKLLRFHPGSVMWVFHTLCNFVVGPKQERYS